MTDTKETSSQTVERLAVPHKVETADGRTLVIAGGKVVDTHRESDAPDHHVRQKVKHRTADSFMAYLKQFCLGSTAVYNVSGVPTAIFDDHVAADKPGTQEWRAVLEQEPHSEMQAIKQLTSAEWISRGDFAEAMLAVQHLIARPDALEVLELVQQLNVSKNTEFAAGENLSNGARTLSMVEKQTATGGGAKQLTIPPAIVFAAPFFEGDSLAVEVECKLRYRLRESTGLEMRLDCYTWDRIDREQNERSWRNLKFMISELETESPVPTFEVS
jgi:hypothetical protein